MAEEGVQRARERGKNFKKGNKLKQIPKTLSYLFQKGGLMEKNISLQTDGYVNVNDILDIYSDFTEEDLYEVASRNDEILFRPCPATNQPQIKLVSQIARSAEPSVGAGGGQPSSSVASAGQYQKLSQRHVKLSKFMSYILRHGAEREGLELQPGGFVYADDILKKRQAKDYSIEDVVFVVTNNEKQRFFMEKDPQNGRYRIRANQGHTLKVTDLELHLITNPDEYPVVVHGTYKRFIQPIKQQGLSRMKRNHIHMAPGEPGESGVISGMRSTCDVLIYINLKKAMQDGIAFYISANNVILTSGDEKGSLKPEYFLRVEERR